MARQPIHLKPPINMNPSPPLTGSSRRTYKTIFQHPISHNLEWRSVYSLLEKLGELTEEPNGNLKATRNGQTLVLTPPRTKDVAEADEVMILRHFLEQSEPKPEASNQLASHFLLVINHHEARIFRSEMQGALPQQFLPHEPDDFFRHAHNSKDFSKGKEKPDPNSFFEPVAQALQAAGQILVFGAGTGTSSEMDQFVAWVHRHHPEVAKRIIGSLVVDENHLTDDQLLAKAREFYALPSKSLT
jgi:hypothetical protein